MGIDELAKKVILYKESEVGRIVDGKIAQFEAIGNGSTEDIFLELCFCLMTANCSAERGIRAQEEICEGFLTLPEPELKKKIRKTVCRFYNNKTDFVMSARGKKEELGEVLKNKSGKEVRAWLVKNINGLGFKEASHFLRNIGYRDIAIIDFHIIDLLERNDIIKRPNTVGKKQYLEIERTLEVLAKRTETNLAELDLYLWYLETGKILK